MTRRRATSPPSKRICWIGRGMIAADEQHIVPFAIGQMGSNGGEPGAGACVLSNPLGGTGHRSRGVCWGERTPGRQQES